MGRIGCTGQCCLFCFLCDILSSHPVGVKRHCTACAFASYLVLPEVSELVSEFILFLSCTMLKSASLEKSVLLPWPMRRADLRDSSNRTSSIFFFTSGPPF